MNRPLRPRVIAVAILVVVALTSTVLSAWAAPPPAGRADGQRATPMVAPTVRPGEVIVKTASGRRGRGLPRALSRVGGRAAQSIGRGLRVVAVSPGSEQKAAQALTADPSVVYAEPNYLRVAASHADEPGWGVDVLRAPPLWDRSPALTGAGVRVAILDSGVDNHPQLRSRLGSGFDAFGANGRDNCGHGTAVAGVVAAAHDGRETVGIAPEATIVPVKVLDYNEFFGACVGDDASIVRGIEWAVAPGGGAADIINLSLSGPQQSRALQDAITHAVNQGVLVTAASGNAGDRVPNYPAAYSNVVSVGGLQRDSGGGVEWWPFSSFGGVDVAAPAKSVPVLLASRVPPQRIGRQCPPGDAHPLCSDGTSFASPHIAGLAALLLQQHPEIATMTAMERMLRLRQWLMGTAVDIADSPSDRGVDLKTGHGRADAAAAVALSDDAGAVIVTWEAGGRIVSPTPKMRADPSALVLTAVVTDGSGRALSDRTVDFSTSAMSTLSTDRGTTDANGRATTVFRSAAQGRTVRITAVVAGRSLPIEAYVLHRDDNIPGVKLPPSRFRGALDIVFDSDDVFRVKLFAGETLRARLRGVDPQREFVDLYLHDARITDVTDPEEAPLREDSARFELDPIRLKYTAPSEGRRYLDVFGLGTYGLKWWILSPGKVDNARAVPSRFTPNGDGEADRTRIIWRVRRVGTVVLRIRNSNGKVVRRVDLGRETRGKRTFRWDGRNNRGRLLSAGTYRAVVRWDNGRGRISKTRTKVRLSR